MSEPKEIAGQARPVVPGVLHWTVHDDRVDVRSDAYAVVGAGTVLIDPLPLAEEALAALTDVQAICLTKSSHQRSAWRYRKRFGARVYAPQGSEDLEESPDAFYGDGDVLPGGLLAFHAPGPAKACYALLLERREGGVLFCGDVLIRPSEAEGFRFVTDDYQEEPARTRESARRLETLKFATLCSAHGAPAVQDGVAALRDALARDRRP